MLNIPISSIEAIILMFLLLCWAGLLIGGWVFSKEPKNHSHRIPLAARLGSSFVLMLAGWMWFAITQGTQVNGLATGIAIGMSFGFVGDIFMAGEIPVKQPVLYGMAAFGIGHLVYIYSFWHITSQLEGLSLNAGLMLGGAILAALLWYVIVVRAAKMTPLHLAALPYSLLLMTTLTSAAGLALLHPLFVVMMIGALLFMLSDTLLSLQLFREWHIPYLSDIIWGLYGTGQMLIVFGVILDNLVANFIITLS